MNHRLPVAWMAVSLAVGWAGLPAQEQDPATPPAAERSEQVDASVEPAVQAWVQTLVRRIADAHPGIRRSAREALVALGQPALPALRQHATSSDPEVAAAAKEVMSRIDRGGGGRRGRSEAPGPRPGGGAMRLLADLGLDDAQKKTIKELMESGARKRRELFQDMRDGTLSREEMRAALRDLQAESMKALEGVLNEEQLAGYRKVMRERGRRGEGRARPDRRGPRKPPS
jgi:hypothetical protein